MPEHVVTIESVKTCIVHRSGYVYVYVMDHDGKTSCYTMGGYVESVRGVIQVKSRIEALEFGVAFPGSE